MHGWSLFFMFASGGWLVGDFMEIHVFELLWCCEYVFDWWEVIPTVSLAMDTNWLPIVTVLFTKRRFGLIYVCVCYVNFPKISECGPI